MDLQLDVVDIETGYSCSSVQVESLTYEHRMTRGSNTAEWYIKTKRRHPVPGNLNIMKDAP